MKSAAADFMKRAFGDQGFRAVPCPLIFEFLAFTFEL
jgi:hypothetical protein